jgi:pyrroline-5-carboxylate reductase
VISKLRSLNEMRVAVIGAGKIGTSLLQAMLQKEHLSPKLVHATVQHPEKSGALNADLGVRVSVDNVGKEYND